MQAEAGDIKWMEYAIDLSRRCPVSEGAFSVGAVIVSAEGEEITFGYSRETDAKVHAEESALIKAEGIDLSGATIYSTLEPCSQRASRPKTCAQLILASGISRLVTAWREPSLFVADCQGIEILSAAGLEVVELTELADEAKSVNAHLGL